MRILFCAAEQEELECAALALRPFESKLVGKVQVDFLLTGIGSTSTCYNLTKKIIEAQNYGSPYTLAVNVGVAGSFDLEKFPIGSIALVETEKFGDSGFMTNNGFLSLFDSNVLDANLFPYRDGKLHMTPLQEVFDNIFKDFKRANGITIQAVTSSESLSKMNISDSDIESMEGASFFYVCLNEHIRFIELRAVSNGVGVSDSSKWETPLALESLKNSCKFFFEKLSQF